MTTLIVIGTVPGSEQYLLRLVGEIFTYWNDFHLTIIRNNYEGFAKAYNYGLKKCEGYDDVLIINDDTLINKNTLKLMKDKLWSNDKIGLVSVKSAFRGNHAAFYCVLIKTNVILNIGLLDERFEVGECEDIDYCIRLQDAGYTIDHIEEDIGHFTSRTLATLPEHLYQKKILNKSKLVEKWRGTKWEHAFGF